MSSLGEIPQLWNDSQSRFAIQELDDSLIDINKVALQIRPDHIHWRNGGVSKLLLNLHSLNRTAFYPLATNNAHFIEIYFKMLGMQGHLGYESFWPDKRKSWRPRFGVPFREIDFSVEFKTSTLYDLNTTRVDGSKTIYQAFFPYSPLDSPYELIPMISTQHLLQSMLDARV